jgi:gluconokinase
MTLRAPALVVMGVAGCGKSSVGQAISDTCGGPLIEGDAFHPAANVEKMRAGIPLTDADRAGWLDRLAEQLAQGVERDEHPVLACSALRRRYRDRLRQAVPELGFVFLELQRDEAARRVQARQGHYMPASLIDSQFATLEPPDGEPGVLTLDATLTVEEQARRACRWWQGGRSTGFAG